MVYPRGICPFKKGTGAGGGVFFYFVIRALGTGNATEAGFSLAGGISFCLAYCPRFWAHISRISLFVLDLNFHSRILFIWTSFCC